MTDEMTDIAGSAAAGACSACESASAGGCDESACATCGHIPTCPPPAPLGEQAAELIADQGFIEAATASLSLLGACFCHQPNEDAAPSLAAIRSMDVASDWPFGDDASRARAAELFAQGADEDEHGLRVEFTRMFRGPAFLQAPPWGSVYMDREQVRYGCTWLELRDWMRVHLIKSLYEEKEPEDQFGRLLMLAGQVCAQRPDLFPDLLQNHLLTWAFHYLDKFDADVQSPTYAGLGVLARATLADLRDLMQVTPAVKRFYR